METKLRQTTKNYFKKYFLKLMNNAVFGKSMENVRKHRNTKHQIATIKRRRNNLVSEPSYHTTKFFTENLLVIDTRKTGILMNKPIHIG